ncbi:MAG: YdiY family protein [bacterium]
MTVWVSCLKPLRGRGLKTIARVVAILACLGLLVAAPAITATEGEAGKRLWEKHMELSYVNTMGNTDTIALSAKADASREGESNRYFIKGNVLYGEDNDVETQNKWSVDGRWERTFTERFFWFLSANYMEDKFSGYDYRTSGGPGLGYDLITTDEHRLKSLLSSLYHFDRYDGTGHTDSYVSPKAQMDYKWQISENLRFKQILEYLVSTEQSKKYFIDSESSLSVAVNRHISLGVSYTLSYQNLTPVDVEKHTDATFLTSLIIDF